MAESKQYITQVQENGSVQISEDVISTIVAHAVSDVEGVVGLEVKPVADIAELIGKKNWGKGVKVSILDDDSVKIECNVNVIYGCSVVNVANAAQSAICNAVEAMTGVTIHSVNVNVCGITRQ